MAQQPFPASGATISITVAAASAAVALPLTTTTPPAQVRLVNLGPSTVFVAFGTAPTAVVATGTASTSATPILPGSDVILSRPPDASQIATILNTGGASTVLLVTIGDGD